MKKIQDRQHCVKLITLCLGISGLNDTTEIQFYFDFNITKYFVNVIHLTLLKQQTLLRHYACLPARVIHHHEVHVIIPKWYTVNISRDTVEIK